MKQIDVIFPAYINATIGPCGTLRRILANKSYINKRGYNINIFTLDSLIKTNECPNAAVDFSRGLKLRSAIKRILFKSVIGYVIMHKHNVRLAQKLINYYVSLNRTADVVVFHETNACNAYKSFKRDRQKVVCFFHSDGTRFGMTLKAFPFLKNSRWIKRYDKYINDLLPKIDRYVFITKIGQENFLKENIGINKNKTSFFHNGIEDKPLSLKYVDLNPKYRLCSIGTLCNRKGQYLIVEALTRLPSGILDQISLTLYGIGPDYGRIKDMVKDYGLQGVVTLYGNLMNENVHDELSKHNIFLLMSNNEGLPISIIEAMRAGLPIISTKVSGIPEQVDDRNGILIAPDVDELSQLLSNIDKYDWKTMGNNSRIRFETEFTFASMLQGYCDMIDATLES